MNEEQRKYILSFEEEDPLLMAYVEGQKHPLPEHDARVRDNVLDELEKTRWTTITAPDLSLSRREVEWIMKESLEAKIKSLRRGEHQ